MTSRKTVKAFFEYVENNPLGWQARNRKFILNEWLNHGITPPLDSVISNLEITAKTP